MAISLNGLYSGYDDMYSSSNKVDLENLQSAINSASSTSTDDELMQVCKDFESYFVEQVFKAMEKMVPDSDEEESDYMQMFGDTLTQEYAKNATEQGEGLGLAQMLYEQMKRNFQI